MSTANKILMGASGAAGGGEASDDEFNRVSFLSHFDGENNGVNNVFDDASASNHTITSNGNVTQGSFGPFARPDGEWGVSFDGASDRLRTNASNLDITTEAFTAEAWIFPVSSMDQYDIIVCMFAASHGSNANQTWSIRAGASNTIEIVTISSGTQTIQSAGTANIGAWNHVAISRSSTTMYAALNGVVTSASCASSLNGHEYFYIGAADANGSVTYFFNGAISNVRYEIGNARYTSNYTVPTSKLTATTNTKILTCQSNRFVDNSTSNNTFLISGNPAVTSFGPFLTSEIYSAATNGASASFDYSASTNLSAADSADWDFGSGNYTVEFWMYATRSGVYQGIFNQWADFSASNIAWSFEINTSNRLAFLFKTSGLTVLTISSSTGDYLNQWVHVAAVRDSNTHAVYLNGVSKDTTTDSGSIQGCTDVLRVGAYFSGDGFDGYICDARVVKGTAVYTSNFTPPTAPLTAITNTKLLLNMADGQAIDSTAQHNLSLENGTNISTAQAKFGDSSIFFDGTTDTATVIGSENVNFGAANFTVEGWIRPASFSGYKPNIISKWTNGSRGWAVRLVASGSGFVMRFTFSTDGSNDASLDATTVLAFDTWHHFAFVQNSNTVTCYANGTANGTISCSTIFASTNPIILGDWDTNQADYNGYIDDIRVTTGFARYTSNFSAPSEPFPDKGQ